MKMYYSNETSQSQLNKRLKMYLTLILLCIISISCVKQINLYQGDKDKEEEKEKGDDVPDIVERVEDLKFESIMIRPDENEFIYGNVSFKPNADKTKWTATIRNYKADLSQLKIIFEATADHITVGDVKQFSGETVNDFREEVVFRLHTANNEYRDFTLSVVNPPTSYSGFPILAIMTKDGLPITSKEDWIPGRIVLDPQQSDYTFYSGEMNIKGRGHNSWGQPKKPYNVKLAEKSSLMGMNKHKRWSLLANASDRTLMRNRVAYHLGRLTKLPWTSDTRYVDVMLNGEFVGNYLLTEQIRVDKNRVNITEAKEGMSPEQVGYLLEFDRYVEENYFYTQRRQLPVNIKDPDEDILTPAHKEYISNYINKVEELLYEKDQIDVAYRDMIDIDTFIDWWIVTELTENRDTKLPGSCHMYKDAGGKLCAGPLWDFDLTTFLGSTNSYMHYDYEVDLNDPQYTNRSLWYKRLFTDPVFKARAKERWNQYKPLFDKVSDFIDGEKNNIGMSATRNWEIWEINEGSTNKDERLSWEDAVEQLKRNYNTRLNWLDKQINQW